MIEAIAAIVRRLLESDRKRGDSAMEETEFLAKKRLENIRVGYHVAAQLWVYEGQALWSAFNAMLVANAIVVAAEGASGGALIERQPVLRWVMPMFGLLLSLLWYALVDRGFTIHDYRVLSTRDLERYLEPVETVSRGAIVNAGDQVCFTFPSEAGPKRVQLSCVGKLLGGKELAIVVTVLFALFHVVVLGLTFFGGRPLGISD